VQTQVCRCGKVHRSSFPKEVSSAAAYGPVVRSRAIYLTRQSHRKVDMTEPDPRFGCTTRYKALIIRDNGKMSFNPESNGGTGCPPIDRDRHAFTYLADKYVHTEGPKKE